MDFQTALAAAQKDCGGKGIGTLGEKTLHLTLKYLFAPDPDTHERKIGGFVADAVTEDGVVEIQTRSLSRLKPKLAAFLPLCPVTVVVPVIEHKMLLQINTDGELLSQRMSPKHESVWTAMREIYLLRSFLQDPNLEICLCMMNISEYVLQKSKKVRLDRVPAALNAVHRLRSPQDYRALLPDPVPEIITSAALGTMLRISQDTARYYINLLCHLGCAEEIGRDGRQKQWRLLCVSENSRG